MDITTKLLTIGVLALGIACSASLAEMPLLDSVANMSSVGPRTEPVNLSAYQHVVRVKPGAADALKIALDTIADAGDKNRYAVLVSGGTIKQSKLQMKPFVDLFGGFDERGENRDIAKNPTILDAGGAGPVVIGADNARLDGFVVTHGSSQTTGGGIVCEHVSPVISNCVIRENVTTEPPGFRRDMIHQHGADGGGIAAFSGSAAEIRNNLIFRNTTEIGNGAGIYIWNESKPKIINNVICENRAGTTGHKAKEGSRSSNGGGIAVSKDCQPLITGNVIVLNTVADNSDGGGIYLEYDANATITGNWIAGNFAVDDGGGLYVMKGSTPILQRNVLAGNWNTSGGSGAIRLSKDGRLRASHNLFIANPTGIDAVGSWMVFTHNTFIDCTANGIIYENNNEHHAPSRVFKNIFYGKMSVPFILKPGKAEPIVRDNLIPGGFPGEGNISVDPMFVDDSLKGAVAQRQFDPALNVTTVATGANLPPKLAGRIINVGKQWSVIRSNNATSVTIWGEITDTANTFLIPGNYQPAEGSPCRSMGAYASE